MKREEIANCELDADSSVCAGPQFSIFNFQFSIFNSFCALVLVSLTARLGVAQPSATGNPEGSHWVGTWAASAQAIDKSTMPPTPPGLAETTLRQIVHVSIGGQQLRVRFSNAFSAFGGDLTIDAVHVAVSAGGSAIKAETDHAVKFQGKPTVTIPYGALMVSDPVSFGLAPGSDLAVTVHLHGAAREITGHRGARCISYLQAGEALTAPNLSGASTAKVWYYLSGVDVLAPPSAAAVVCLGDSITDGHGATDGANRRWPDFLARRLLAGQDTAQVGVLNEGIGGNGLWRGGIGQTAVVRLDRDILAQPGARWLIVLEGINDLGGGKTSADELIAAYRQIIVRGHDRGLLVFGATIMPCGGSFYFKPRLEEHRQRVNEWIRSSGAFDGVIDFDAALRDPQNSARLIKAADCGDHLHPNDEGYRRMAETVDLKIFKKNGPARNSAD
jgi:lysophospholipase L1-like esterase